MRRLIVSVLLAAMTQWAPAADNLPPGYSDLKTSAEQLYADGSYARAHEAYARAAGMSLPPFEARWVQFRLADTQWRAEAGTRQTDTTKLDAARHGLEVLVRDATRADQHDRVWAEVEESLGDFHWTRRDRHDWGAAWPLYQQALEWWAGASDIELARERYLKMVWKMARPPQSAAGYYYGSWGNYVPLEVLDNALRIATTDNDKAHLHYLIASTLRNQGGDEDQRARVPDEYEAALKAGKGTDWYDDALYHYGEWMVSYGRSIPLAEGGARQEPDYVKGLALFKRLVSEFAKGQTRYWEPAQQQIRGITDPQVSVSVANVFLPDSEIQYQLSWRNVKRIGFALYPLDMNRDVRLKPEGDWLHAIELNGLEKLKSWSRDTHDTGEHKPGYEAARLDGKLKPGAYLLVAEAGGQSARDLVLVSDAMLVMKSSSRQALLYLCNALDSEPLGGAKFNLWQRWHDGSHWQVRNTEKTADAQGTAVFELEQAPNSSVELFATATLKDRQTFSSGNHYGYRNPAESWRIYAFTDRPAYRPNETVQWKFIARQYDGSTYSTPANATVEFQIHDPRGATVKESKAKLNEFGSAWGSLEVTAAMPLGEYHITFWSEGRKQQLGTATLFRLEEYKLPEFKVSVKTPEENGRQKAFRLGEKVEATIEAEYYFGGPVADGTVEVLVYQNPFYHYWHSPREFPWFYDDMGAPYGGGRWYGGAGGQIIKRETLKTDSRGKATLTFETPRNAGQDFQYRIEARVVDSSRREITGSGTVHVTRQRYYVYPQPEHNLYHPQDTVRVGFKALDANEQPIQTDGTVKVTRDYWEEIWLSPEGKEIKGHELERLRAAGPVFPPAPKPNQAGWTLKFRGYHHDEIATRTVRTDTNGLAEFTFKPEREGYYGISWTSEDRVPALSYRSAVTNLVQATASVWVAGLNTTELGYRQGGVELIIDKDTFRAGQKAAVMLVTPANGRHVLFTVEGDSLYDYQVVHLDGTVKLLELDIQEKHVPNIFLSAVLVADRQVFMDTKQVIVPPARNFLTVDVRSDRAQYEPREEGTFTITTRNDAGKPVSAELAFGLVDESVYYIQQDYAGDPRQFFFGSKRQQLVQTYSTLNQKPYARLVRGKDEQLLDELDVERRAGMAGARGESLDRLSELSVVNKLGDMRGGMEDAFRKRYGASGGAMNYAFRAGAAAPASVATKELAVNGAVTGLPVTRVPGEQPQPGEPAVQVRSDFRSTVFWQPDVHTDDSGRAVVKVKYPDSLTAWKATARAVSAGNQFGIAETNTHTQLPLLVRLQAPRFFVVGDVVTLSAVVNNNTARPMQVRVELQADGGLEIRAADKSNSVVSVPAHGEARADWSAEVKKPGQLKLKAVARGGQHSDAMEKAYTIYEHGIEKFIAKSGKAMGDAVVKLELPRERKAESTSLVVQVTPSMAVTMLDALPYLVNYPYGCTEQTMSRFLPAAITAKTLRGLGLQPEDVMGRVFGGIEPGHAAATHPGGKKDLEELDAMIRASLQRLYDFQHADGGWGWWKEGESDHWMTAYVLWGLSLAHEAGIDLAVGSAPRRGNIRASTGIPEALTRAASYLDKTLVEEEEHPDMQSWMLHALSVYQAASNRKNMSPFQAKAFTGLWKSRDQLNAYTRALFALAAHGFGKTNEAKTLVENLENGVRRDERPDSSILLSPSPGVATAGIQGTAHWGEDGVYWHWSEGGVEATAFALRALLAIDPQNKLVEPVTNWLIKNRRGAQWNSTRDTAIVVLALNDYLKASGELKLSLEYELVVNGSRVASRNISGADVFAAPSRFAIDASLLKDANEIRIHRKSGRGPIYFAAEAKFFSLEEPITPAGNELFVKREYFKLAGRPTLLKGYVYEREPLRDGDSVHSGERVETVLTVETKNNYEYLMFEDLKPAGFEAAQIRSGEALYAQELKSGAVERKFGQTNSPAASASAEDSDKAAARSRLASRQAAGLVRPVPVPQGDESDYTGRTRWVYQELRDRKVALFLDKLPQGVWQIHYSFRAEVPGEFHALPVVGSAMYVPELRCNSAEVRVKISEAEPAS